MKRLVINIFSSFFFCVFIRTEKRTIFHDQFGNNINIKKNQLKTKEENRSNQLFSDEFTRWNRLGVLPVSLLKNYYFPRQVPNFIQNLWTKTCLSNIGHYYILVHKFCHSVDKALANSSISFSHLECQINFFHFFPVAYFSFF